MDSLSLFQRIFPTQESNQGLLHCRWILYQLSYQGSPRTPAGLSKLSHTRYLLCVLKVEYSRTQTIWYAQCQDHELWSYIFCIIGQNNFSLHHEMSSFLFYDLFFMFNSYFSSFICLFVHPITYSTNTVEFLTYSIRCAKDQKMKETVYLLCPYEVESMLSCYQSWSFTLKCMWCF